MERKVLVVQENIVVNKILKSSFRHRGDLCTAMYSLDAVMAKTFHPVYDIVITDLLFKGIRSVDFIKELTSVVSYHQLVIVTSLGQSKVKREIMESVKIDGYYDFPVDLDLL